MTAARDDLGAVAIVGMACLFPGAPDLDAYWRNIVGKVDATCDPPSGTWDTETYFDPTFSDPDRTYCRRGGWIGDLAQFDPLAYGIPPVAVGGEPDQWLALKLAHDALEDAGATELPDAVRARTAVILGKGTYVNGGNAIAVQRSHVVGQTVELLRRLEPDRSEAELDELRAALAASLPALGPETVPGLIPNIIVGRIANRLDLMGPAYTVDAACASSLVAVQHATHELASGRCDLALAGGSQVWMPVATLNLFCRLGALSHQERLRAFDKDADGTLLGEGIGIIVLKRLADARAQGDRIYAAIRGVGVASDGRGMSVMAPRLHGEETALRRAYEEAGVSPATIGLIEAHGTGTPVGDVTEVQALTRVFGERTGLLPPCALGSVKSMISHTIPAAGIASIIKVALALHHRVLPPTLHITEPNPKLELERTPFYLNTETRPWIHGDEWPRRAGVNAFGFGGINAHAVLEEIAEADASWERGRSGHAPAWESEVCVLGGASPEELVRSATELARALQDSPGLPLADLAFTLSRSYGDREATHRLAIVAASTAELRQRLEQAVEKLSAGDCRHIKGAGGIYYESEPFGREAKLVLVFPGEGAQYPNMLADLCLHFPQARAVFDRIDRLYAEHPRGHRLSDWVYPRPAFTSAERAFTEARLMELDIAVESVLTANAAAYAVLRRLLPRIDAMLGHSSGEHSAAMAAGALDVDTDERLATFCLGLNASYADAAARHEIPGAVLLAVGSGAENARRIAHEAGGDLYLAMDNCPHQTVLVGEAQAIARARRLAMAEGFVCEELPYDRAVHTPLFAPFAEDLRGVFAQLPVRAADTAVWSCTTAAPYPGDPAEIRELIVEHWTRPVRFRETIEALHDAGMRVFVECGPRGNMTSFVQDTLRGRPSCAVAIDVRRRSSTTQICHLAATLAAHGIEMDLGALFEHRSVRAVDWRTGTSERGSGSPRRLLIGWPPLGLSDTALERWQHREPIALPASNGHGPHRPPVPWVEPTATPAAVTALDGPEVAVLTADPDLYEHDADVAVGAHLQTMEYFLRTSEQVMQAYLADAAESELAVPSVTPRRWPLVGTVVALEPGRRLVAQRAVDPAHDRYLLAHTLGRTVSRQDPTLHALALMPLAMSIEILAQAAASLIGGLVVTGLRDVRAHRWLAFDEGPHTLELTAEVLDPEGGEKQVRVELRDLDDVTGSEGPAVEGVVILGPGFPAAPRATELGLAEERESRWRPEELYGVMFHQPVWQAVHSVDAVSPDGARARLQALPRDGLLTGAPDPQFTLDPVVLDAAGQLIGFWAADRLEQGRVVFPFRLGSLELFAPPPQAGEILNCSAAIRLVGDQLVSSDIEVAETSGRCMMRMLGWEDKRFAVPEHLDPLSLPTELPALSEPWAGPLEPYGPAVACRRLDSRLTADRELWTRVWASRILSRRERSILAGKTLTAAGKLEWLAARTAAKDAIAELLRSAFALEVLRADIEILPDERGCPIVSVASGDLGDLRAIVSLTHAGGVAAALAALVPAQSAAGVGIDLEPVRAQPGGFAETAFTLEERTLLETLPPEEREEWGLRLWCAREAAGKAVGLGIVPGPATPRITALEWEQGRASVRADDRALVINTRREENLVVATTVWEQAQ